MLMLKTRPAANGRRNMKARLEPFSRSLCRKGRLSGAGPSAQGHTYVQACAGGVHRAWCVACARVHEYTHQQLSKPWAPGSVSPLVTLGPQLGSKEMGGCGEKGGPGHVTQGSHPGPPRVMLSVATLQFLVISVTLS